MAVMERETPKIYTISQLTQSIKRLLETEIGSVWVSGEISNYTCAASGHAYFTLKDAFSQLDAVMFKGRLGRLKFVPENGLDVLVSGKISVYERRGSYQIVVEEMHPKGMGSLQLAYEKLKTKLADEGLFDAKHKKPLPMLPRRIGIVTSPTGAAIRDILKVIHRRFANVHIILYPSRVQGEGAAREIAAGISALDCFGVDVIIAGRGGGSLEDLWAFNEEVVARAIFAANTPIISAVGHEIDYALSDFVADMRAPTPSAAAEMVVLEQSVLVDNLHQFNHRLQQAVHHTALRSRTSFVSLGESSVFTRPDELFHEQRQVLDETRMRLQRASEALVLTRRQHLERISRLVSVLSPRKRLNEQSIRLKTLRQRLGRDGSLILDMARSRFTSLPARLHALSPLAVLGRGYSLAFKIPGEEVLYNASQVASGDALRLWLGAGEVMAEVKSTSEEGGISRYELREKE